MFPNEIRGLQKHFTLQMYQFRVSPTTVATYRLFPIQKDLPQNNRYPHERAPENPSARLVWIVLFGQCRVTQVFLVERREITEFPKHSELSMNELRRHSP